MIGKVIEVRLLILEVVEATQIWSESRLRLLRGNAPDVVGVLTLQSRKWLWLWLLLWFETITGNIK